MTIKELADVAGVSQETIRRTGKRIFPATFRNGVKTKFDEFQSIAIIKDVSKKNMVAPQNEEVAPQNEEVAVQSPQVDYEIIGKMIGMAVSAAMQPVVQQLQNINKNPLQIEAPVKEDYYALTAYCSIKGYKIKRSELILHGKHLTANAKEKGLQIRTIPDERWGKVNSYPVELLDEHFNI
ncbi:MAG: hypothetical protein GY804_03545 [Alphaproteobacteria bacterium]|nr:hypothetical protein [Alphaproteobacteria bacterium]